MRERYQERLTQLQNELLDMGMLCEQAIMKTYQLLISGENRDQLVKEINHLEKEIDGKEQVVESICIQMLLRQQPVASDLRRISAALKMITDLERIGDQAIDIAEILQTGSIDVPVKGVPITTMAEVTVEMVNKSIESYVNKDLELALEVIAKDDTVDSLFLEVRKCLTESRTGWSSDQALDLLITVEINGRWYNMTTYCPSGQRHANQNDTILIGGFLKQ